MDPNAGRIYNVKDEQEAKARELIPVRRDLSAREHLDMQIRLYSPCACGSGVKFKFCCKRLAGRAPRSGGEGEQS